MAPPFSTSSRLDEYDKDEWFDIARGLMPGLSDDEYEEMWAEFQALKAKRTAS